MNRERNRVESAMKKLTVTPALVKTLLWEWRKWDEGKSERDSIVGVTIRLLEALDDSFDKDSALADRFNRDGSGKP